MRKIADFFRSAKFTKDEKLLYKDLKKKYKSGQDMSREEILELSCFESRTAIRFSLLALAINLPIGLISLCIALIKLLA